MNCFSCLDRCEWEEIPIAQRKSAMHGWEIEPSERHQRQSKPHLTLNLFLTEPGIVALVTEFKLKTAKKNYGW